MKKTFAFLFAFAVIGASAVSDQHYKIAAENFDGAKFMARYSLTQDDFHAFYEAGEMHVAIHDNVVIEGLPVFESPDTTKRVQLDIYLAKMGRGEDLTLAQLNEYLRLTAGL